MLTKMLALQAISLAIGDFGYFESADAMDDSLQVAVALQTAGATLTLACDHSRSRSISVAFDVGSYLVSPPSSFVADLMPFNYRIDRNEAESAFSRYGSTAAMIEGRDARVFAERLSGGSQITVRVLTVNGNVDTSFSAQGAAEAIQRLAARCGDRRLLERLNRSRQRG